MGSCLVVHSNKPRSSAIRLLGRLLVTNDRMSHCRCIRPNSVVVSAHFRNRDIETSGASQREPSHLVCHFTSDV